MYKIGPAEEFRNPSDVARRVRSGDRVEIAPGTYNDCVLWPKAVRGLTIEGKDVTISNTTCGGKGIFVVSASDVVIRGITFKGAKSRDKNGAGIRAQGQNLTVENSRFIDNENGILGNSVPGSKITVRNSLFQGNGACAALCSHGIYINKVALVRIEGSEFVGQHRGHHIKSRALQTEIINNHIYDGPTGNSSYLVDIPLGGGVVISGNQFEKGVNAENKGIAISIGEETKKRPANPTLPIRIEGNSFVNDMKNQTIFVRNHGDTPAVLQRNTIKGLVKPLVGSGD